MTAFKSEILPHNAFTKIPEVTLVFWIIKIAATTLGETGGDTVTMTLNWGYLTGTAIFLVRCSSSGGHLPDPRRVDPSRRSTGRRSSPRPRRTPPWPTSQSVAGGRLHRRISAILLGCSSGPLTLWHLDEGSDLGRAPCDGPASKHSTGPPSRSLKRWARRSGDWTADTPASVTKARAGVFGGALGLVAAASIPDEHFPRSIVLDRLHPDSTARRHRRRLPRQAAEPRRYGAQPADRVCRYRDVHHWLHPAPAPTCGEASRRTSSHQRGIELVYAGQPANCRTGPSAGAWYQE